jgi:23S rRNA (uridine2552-2'-O)-methyltransferase
MSNDFVAARDSLRKLFDEVRSIRPEGTRASSVEIFLIGLRRR